MKTRILPLVTGAAAYVTFFASIVVTAALRFPIVVAIICAWGAAVFATIVVTVVLIAFWPDLRFSTKDHIDGMGYVHNPLDVIMPLTMIATCICLVLALR